MEVARVHSTARVRALSTVENSTVRIFSLRKDHSTTVHQAEELQLLHTTLVDDLRPLRAVELKQRGTVRQVTAMLSFEQRKNFASHRVLVAAAAESGK